jgi:hypothetical protein
MIDIFKPKLNSVKLRIIVLSDRLAYAYFSPQMHKSEKII